ncbi:recombinase family protein [Micromonospora inyonensis]|uniref:Site-specific DNA recombinase n=1 Tax=Micromonospora inyonensis TaxID=47866 RepID=A0A1C6S829_9ACTN|nr:recombinase family protein [Micromonospora inyonensis]SCL25419.1 Site-specific DNA recombinase [Micromonospora inyonensis]SCL32209.1 Site-specific DNA recombinase [Micromonospora inyonensis]
MKALIYVRQSQDRSGEELGIARQLADARQLAKLRGWEVIRELPENDTSASGKRQRPQFEAVLAAIEAQEVGAVIAWDMTRLSRNRRDTVRLLEAGERAKITLAFVRGTDLDLSTPAGGLIADILAGVARNEIAVKSDRQRRAALQAAEQGRWVGGRRPFGYEADGCTIREAEAAALRDAYAAVLTGVSLGGVARDWNTRGLHTPQGKRDGSPSLWTSQTVRPTLLNPRYAGLRARGRGKSQQVMAAAEWQAIVPESTWRAAVAVIADPARANPPRGGRSLLTGLAFCGVCGEDTPATVHAGAAPSRKGREGYRTYRCRAAYGHVGRAAEPVDEFVTAVALERLSRPDARDLLIDRDRADVEQLRTEAIALRGRRKALLGLVEDGTYTDAEIRDRAGRLAEKIAAVEAKLADAGRVDILGPLIDADDIRAAWDALDVERQRAVIDTLMTVRLHPPGRGTRTFRPETVEIEWKH